MNFLQKLLGIGSPVPVQPQAPSLPAGNGNHPQVLGIKSNPQQTNGRLQIQYGPLRTPTPTISLPQSNLSRYGDAQGQQWMEDPQGNRTPIVAPKQAFDAPLANRQQQFLRPGVTGAFPTGDATVHVPIPKHLPLRSI